VWEQTIAALALQTGNTCRTLALDVPGCGSKRGRDTSQIAYADIVAEFLADIDASGLRDIVLVGHSQAGSVMPKLAELRPDLFKRLIYISCSSPLAGVTIPEMIGKRLQGESATEVGWFADATTLSAEDRYRAIFCHDMTPQQTEHLLVEMSKDTWPMSSYTQREWRYDHLANTPTSYVVFLQDRALPAAWQEQFAERFHANRLIRIDAGHQGMMTHPHALAEALLIEAALDN
jgi:pimeloyl-ACP methyl ester carboxylesterase